MDHVTPSAEKAETIFYYIQEKLKTLHKEVAQAFSRIAQLEELCDHQATAIASSQEELDHLRFSFSLAHKLLGRCHKVLSTFHSPRSYEDHQVEAGKLLEDLEGFFSEYFGGENASV